MAECSNSNRFLSSFTFLYWQKLEGPAQYFQKVVDLNLPNFARNYIFWFSLLIVYLCSYWLLHLIWLVYWYFYFYTSYLHYMISPHPVFTYAFFSFLRHNHHLSNVAYFGNQNVRMSVNRCNLLHSGTEQHFHCKDL